MNPTPADPWHGVGDALRDTGRLLAAFLPPRVRVSRLAVTAVIAGALGLGPLGLAFAFMAATDVRAGRTRGPGLVWFAVVLNLVICFAWIVVIGMIASGGGA